MFDYIKEEFGLYDFVLNILKVLSLFCYDE